MLSARNPHDACHGDLGANFAGQLTGTARQDSCGTGWQHKSSDAVDLDLLIDGPFKFRGVDPVVVVMFAYQNLQSELLF